MGPYIYSTYTYVIFCPSYDWVTDWLNELHPACYICRVSMVTQLSQPEFHGYNRTSFVSDVTTGVSVEFINKQWKNHVQTAVKMLLHYNAGLIFILSIRRGKTRALVKLCGRVPKCLASAKTERWLCMANRTGSSAKGLRKK